jgi:outer membrane receptor protein involved in Fe transport
MDIRIRHRFAWGVAVGALSCTSVALAQEKEGAATAAPEADSAASAVKIDQVIVTAARQPQLLQEVPLSITALSEKNIESQGIRSFEDYAARIAGVRLSRDSSQSSFSIRGVSSSAGADTTSATAGLYLDDYPIYDTWFRFSSPDVRIFDVERIEVLRGPQGTLYGATSLSGSIRMITNKPDLQNLDAKFAGTGSNTSGGGRSHDLNAMLNVPLSEGVAALRAVAYDRKDGGYVDNRVIGKNDTNEQRTRGGRLALRLKPTDSLDLLASVMYQRDEQDDQSATYYTPPAGHSDTEWNGSVLNSTTSTLQVATLVADQKLASGNVTVTGIHSKNESVNTFDATPLVFLLSGVRTPTAESRPSDSSTNIVELRYTTDPAARLRYVLGAYYNSRKRDFAQQSSQDTLLPLYGTNRLYLVAADQTATEKAVFGEGTWSIIPQWDATVGLRYSRNAYHFNGRVSGLTNNAQDPLSVSATDVSNDQSSFLPRVSLSYKPDAFTAFYGTVSKGYRFGLTNYNSGTASSVPLNYKSDTLWNYEIGAKTTILGGRGTLNSSLFYIDWKDMQLPFRNANNQVYITNAGDARTYGLETELALKVTPAFEVNAALTLGKAEITKGNPGVQRRAASIRGPAVIGILKGDRLPGSQRVSASAGAQYTIRQLAGGSGYARVDAVHVGSSYVDFMEEGSLRTGDYNVVNLRLGYKFGDYEITAFANNAFGSDGIVSAVPNADLIGTDAAFRVRPRTMGLTLRANY